jgi:hypothetical protein
MKKFLIIILLAASAHAYAGHQTKRFLIQFATDQHSLDPAALQKLDEVTAFLKTNPTAKIKLTGRTDFDGTIGYNINLSRLRTTEVSEFLKTKGFNNAEIDEKWVGELKPIATNTDDNGKALNRSVEILITLINYDNATEWLKEKELEFAKDYKLNRSGQNTITTANETIITIPANAFIDANGKAIDNKNVNLVVKEVNSTYDALVNQVFTMSGDKLLETGGMLNIEAYSNASKLTLADGKEIQIEIPTVMKKNDMFVFEGVADNTGKIDWKNTGKPFATNEQRNRVSLKLNEDVLKELIAGIDHKKPAFQDFTLSYTVPKLVNIPTKPRLPKEPVKPEARQLFSTLGWLFSTKSMKENRVEKTHKKNMEEYEKRMANYTKRMERYEVAMIQQKIEIEKHKTEIEQLYSKLKETRNSVNLAISTIYDEHDKMRAHRGLYKLYTQSANGTQYSSRPLNYLRTFARTTRLTEEENMKLEYLYGIKRSLSRFIAMDYPDLYKKYARGGKLKIMKVAKSDIKYEMLNCERLWTNKFLDNYILENKESFTEVFENEMNEQLTTIAKQQVATKQMESREYFTGNVKKMGWINCDRFVNSELITVTFKKYPGAYQAVIINSLNSVLNPSYYQNSEEVTAASVPRNEKFRLLTLRIEGDQAYISVMEATATSGLKLEPEFKKVPIEDVDKVLAKL